MGLTYPQISPVFLHLGLIDIRWYSLAYLVGIVAAWFLILKTVKKYKLNITKAEVDDLIFNITLGIILGGRIFYALFYNLETFLNKPLEIFAIWHGGMSFHGGLIGVIVALYLSARKMKYPFFGVCDLAALYAPIGLFLGRLANFVNDELWGRVTDVPWAVKFPNGGYLPRHPSQIYEALLEGLVLFAVLNVLFKFEFVRERKGLVSGVFLVWYALARMFVELFRQPDEQIGFVFEHMTMGQLLSIPFLLFGCIVLFISAQKKS